MTKQVRQTSPFPSVRRTIRERFHISSPSARSNSRESYSPNSTNDSVPTLIPPPRSEAMRLYASMVSEITLPDMMDESSTFDPYFGDRDPDEGLWRSINSGEAIAPSHWFDPNDSRIFSNPAEDNDEDETGARLPRQGMLLREGNFRSRNSSPTRDGKIPQETRGRIFRFEI